MEKLSYEILKQILGLTRSTTSNFRSSSLLPFVLVDHFWNDVATPLLYSSPVVDTKAKIQSLLHTLEEKPALAQFVRGLDIALTSSSMSGEEMSRVSSCVLTLIRACTNLEALTIDSVKVDLGELLASAPTLRELKCTNNQLEYTPGGSKVVANALQRLDIQGGTDFRGHYATNILLPRLQHLRFRHAFDGTHSDPFCDSLQSLVTLDVDVDVLTIGMGRLLATCAELDHLRVSIDACNSWDYPSLMSSLSEVVIHSLILTKVKDLQDVVTLLVRDERALTDLKLIRVEMDETEGKAREAKNILKDLDTCQLEELCRRRDISILGFTKAEESGDLA